MFQPELHVLVRVSSTSGNGVKFNSNSHGRFGSKQVGDSSVVGRQTHDQ